MDYIDLKIIRSLLLRSPEIFKHYFTDLNGDRSANHDEAIKIFKNYGYPTSFEEFVKNYLEWCKNKQTSITEAQETDDSITDPKETSSFSRKREIEDEPPTRWNLEPIFRQSISVIPPLKRRKREREAFNAVDFLLEKIRSDEAVTIKFQSDDDVQEELASSEVTDKKIGLLADGILKKIADQVELLNQLYNHQVLEIHHEYY